jgi:hypothetical protein
VTAGASRPQQAAQAQGPGTPRQRRPTGAPAPALPGQLRQALRESGRDLREEFQAAPVRSSWPGVVRLRAPHPGAGFSATWYDVFRGGCVTIALRPATEAAAVDRSLADQVPAIVGYVSRASLQHELALRSGGRLRLDPSR